MEGRLTQLGETVDFFLDTIGYAAASDASTPSPITEQQTHIINMLDGMSPEIQTTLLSYCKFPDDLSEWEAFDADGYIASFQSHARLTRDEDPPMSEVEQYSDYADYLKSEHWITRRARARTIAGNKCQLCGRSDRQLQVHHNCYDNLGHEPDEDLIVLCDNCHGKHHDIPETGAAYGKHEGHMGMVCPSCGTELVTRVQLFCEV